jgi:signal transduction histidine kinase
MSGTNHTTGGLRRITRKWPRWDLRLAVFAAALAAGLFLIVRVQSSVGRQMAALEQELSAVKAESFYVGVRARVRLRSLNEQLLDFHLYSNPTNRATVVQDAEQLGQWLRSQEGGLNSDRERELFKQVEEAYARYRAATGPLLDLSGESGPAAFTDTYQRIQQHTRPLVSLIEEFTAAQQRAFADFLGNSQGTLVSLRRLLSFSLILLLSSTIVLAALLYRGMIGPLRRSLTESQSVIERQEKLVSLGTLAAGVAHEIRNPLTALKFRLFSLRKALSAEFADHEDIAVIGAELNRLERIVKDFLQFARPSDPEAVDLPAQRLMEEVRDLLATQLDRSGISLRFERSPVVWIKADVQQIKQVLINLVQNAAESINRNGTITLGLRVATEPLSGLRCEVAILSVADTGPGISPEVERRLFDPFFTTKQGGTGLGLAIAARIVEKHGGLLRYQTKLNSGTTFEMVLPRVHDHATSTPDR